jgi:hypothetical protein
MERAYAAVSDNGKLPANARQLMYGARPLILKLTGRNSFTDSYFTQTLLPDYVSAHPSTCADWDVVFDDRGHFIEPHTGRSVPLGTIKVRAYLGQHGTREPTIQFASNTMYPTSGPENRYRNVLFVEKEGFDALLQQARIAERFDIAVMSTKGVSVTAARRLLDQLGPRIERVFVLHDFDLSGFTIAGTLTTDGRRYIYENRVDMIDLGLRLTDIETMDLQSEPVPVRGDRASRMKTIARHGATSKEISFLLGEDGKEPRRVELNAMTSRQFVQLLETKLSDHRVEKVVPKLEVLERHARRLIEQKFTKDALDEIRTELAKRTSDYPLPAGLEEHVRLLLNQRPELSWDMGLGLILKSDEDH